MKLTQRRYGLLAAVLFLGAILSGVVASSALSSPDRPEDGTSYALSDFGITYPYDDPRADVGPDPSTALVSYRLDWETAGYPGEASCYIELRDASGDIAGSLTFSQSSGVTGVRGPGTLVPVSSPPTTGRGWCGTPGDTSGSGYNFSEPTKIVPRPPVPGDIGGIQEGRVAVTFDVRWDGSSAPGLHTCTMELVYADGSRQALAPFSLSMVDPQDEVTYDLKSDRPDEVRDVDVSCMPYQPQG